MYRVDLNSDLGESFGRYTLGMDDKIIPLLHLQMWRVGIMHRIRW